jgi:hypothetical protein
MHSWCQRDEHMVKTWQIVRCACVQHARHCPSTSTCCPRVGYWSVSDATGDRAKAELGRAVLSFSLSE